MSDAIKNDCRACGHKHPSLMRRYVGFVKVVDKCKSQTIDLPLVPVGERGVLSICDCNTFIPLDNLDYLEYKLLERSL